jgi:Ca2+-binding EF-hand superfamily protein
MTQQMKSRMLSGLVVAMVIGLAAASTFAHDKGADMMAQVDTNHDGSISAAEHAAHAQAMFEKMDANHDGMVSKAEMDAGMKSMHAEHDAMDHDTMDHDAMKDDTMPPKP